MYVLCLYSTLASCCPKLLYKAWTVCYNRGESVPQHERTDERWQVSDVYLTSEEQGMLAGAEGPGVRRAMEIVVALARIYGAADLAPVAHAQIAGVSYKNVGDAGVEFLSRWADEGAKVRVPTTLNPMGMERGKWQQWGISTDFAAPQLSVIDAFAKMGVTPTLELYAVLVPGAHAEARGCPCMGRVSAVAFANSVIGARSNREGGPERHCSRGDRPHRPLRLSSGRESPRYAHRRGPLPRQIGRRFRRIELHRGQGGGQRRAVVR